MAAVRNYTFNYGVAHNPEFTRTPMGIVLDIGHMFPSVLFPSADCLGVVGECNYTVIKTFIGIVDDDNDGYDAEIQPELARLPLNEDGNRYYGPPAWTGTLDPGGLWIFLNSGPNLPGGNTIGVNSYEVDEDYLIQITNPNVFLCSVFNYATLTVPCECGISGQTIRSWIQANLAVIPGLTCWTQSGHS